MTDQNTWQTGEELPKRKADWQDLPAHIKISYQSQAQYERIMRERAK